MFHSWDDDNEEYEILGLRKLLREAVAPEEYQKATPEHCRKLGMTEYRRISAEGDRVWYRTFNELKKTLGRLPTGNEHAAAIKAAHKKEID